MTARIEQTLDTPDDRSYTLRAFCGKCETSWTWTGEDWATMNYADLKAEVDEHNKEEHGEKVQG